MFKKVEVNGDAASPLFDWLKLQPGWEGDVKWNFEKWLLNGQGKVLKRYGSAWDEEAIRKDVADAIANLPNEEIMI